LADEIREAGFENARILAIEGIVWSGADSARHGMIRPRREKLMEFLSLIEREPSILGASAHIMAVSTPGELGASAVSAAVSSK